MQYITEFLCQELSVCDSSPPWAGLLHTGDVVHEINGTAVHRFSVDQVADLMAGLQGTVVFKITSAIPECRPKRRTQVRKFSISESHYTVVGLTVYATLHSFST